MILADRVRVRTGVPPRQIFVDGATLTIEVDVNLGAALKSGIPPTRSDDRDRINVRRGESSTHLSVRRIDYGQRRE
jgi:hypothetical protein